MVVFSSSSIQIFLFVIFELRHLVMQAMVKCADVSNPAKPFEIYAEWVARIMEEFVCLFLAINHIAKNLSAVLTHALFPAL